MIVKCASCQTRFKIGDDKVTEKGVKVRCTKCGTVFVVRKGDDQGTGPEPSPRSKTPLAPDSVGSLDDLFSMPNLGTTSVPSAAPATAAALDDPFAGFLAGPTASPATSAKNDLMPGEFALATAPAGQASDASSPAPPGATPMADLLGLESAWPAAAPSPASKPPRSPTSKPPRSSGSRPPKPPPDASDPFEAALNPLGSPASIHPPPDPFANLASARDPSGDASEAASFGLADGGGDGNQSEPHFDPLAGLSLDPTSIPHTSEEPGDQAPSPEPSGELFERPPRPPPPQPVIETQSALSETTVERQRGRGLPMDLEEGDQADRPLAAKVFSAFAGASVVALLLLAFVAYRNGGRIDLHDPLSTIFAAFGFSRPRAVSESLTTRISQSGLYPTLRGQPMLFVRGSVENLSGGPQRVGLKLEVSSQGQVVATAEGVPGSFPTPEDLFEAKDGPEIKATLDRVSSVPQAPIPPGGRSEFLLVVPDVPPAVLSSVDSTELKVTAHPLLSVADLAPRSANN